VADTENYWILMMRWPHDVVRDLKGGERIGDKEEEESTSQEKESC